MQRKYLPRPLHECSYRSLPALPAAPHGWPGRWLHGLPADASCPFPVKYHWSVWTFRIRQRKCFLSAAAMQRYLNDLLLQREAEESEMPVQTDPLHREYRSPSQNGWHSLSFYAFLFCPSPLWLWSAQGSWKTPWLMQSAHSSAAYTHRCKYPTVHR